MGKRRFAGTVEAQSAFTDASRYDNKRIVTHTRGWNYGVKVTAYVGMNDEDCFDVWLTNGSNDESQHTFVGSFSQNTLVTSWFSEDH